ncbi:MAG: bacillithiol biosynthesis cysteine-adding enzyme BshC [Saprospiraceae bacterium]
MPVNVIDDSHVKVLQYTYDQIPQFAQRDKDYQLEPEKFLPFLSFLPNYDGISKAITQRSTFTTDRLLLKSVLVKQYEHLALTNKQQNHLDKIIEENTYTVTCAHQPCIFTGPAYYLYKIFSTINLAEELSNKYPKQHFVPIFINGAEDHDFEEINHTTFFQKRVEWNENGKGPVGRYKLDNFSPVLEHLYNILGSSDKAIEIISASKLAIENASNYNEFVHTFIHKLTAKYGILVLNMDNPSLKRAFIPIMEKELFENPSEALVLETQNKIEQLGFKAQAYPREINLFYFTEDGSRERIVFENNQFHVLTTNLFWTQDEMKTHLHQFPEKFSPNVVTRPLYQSLVLPDVAFIGGGGEIAYWMERKTQFDYFGLFFPCLIRRNSVILINKAVQKNMEKLSMNFDDFLLEEDKIIHEYLLKNNSHHDELELEKKNIQESWNKLTVYFQNFDQTLKGYMESEGTKVDKMLHHVEQKLFRVLKLQEETKINQIKNVKEKLFPGNNLQERVDNLLQYYIQEDFDLLDVLVKLLNPLEKDCKVLIF